MNTMQNKIIADLNKLGVEDVYFHKGVLFIVNHYDIDIVDEYIQNTDYVLSYRYIDEDVVMFA